MEYYHGNLHKIQQNGNWWQWILVPLLCLCKVKVTSNERVQTTLLQKWPHDLWHVPIRGQWTFGKWSNEIWFFIGISLILLESERAQDDLNQIVSFILCIMDCLNVNTLHWEQAKRQCLGERVKGLPMCVLLLCSTYQTSQWNQCCQNAAEHAVRLTSEFLRYKMWVVWWIGPLIIFSHSLFPLHT